VIRLKSIRFGREQLAPGHCLARHRHLAPYAIIAIGGHFDQTGYAGRIQLRAGELLVQPTLDCHTNRMPRTRGATIVRLPWTDDDDLGGVFAVRDVDAIARAAERDVREAAALAREQLGPRRSPPTDLPDLLAAQLAGGEVATISGWAERIGVARGTASREFTAAFGVSARQFRAELAARRAWLQIVRTLEPLAAIAAATGFADQAHMTRHIGRLTGASPATWRHDARVASYRRDDTGYARRWCC
jgi:AraC-like DNA-binding protein